MNYLKRRVQRLHCGDGKLRAFASPDTASEALEILHVRSIDEDCGLETPCKTWVGAKKGKGKGYGTIRFQGRIVTTHWLSWFIAHGAVPPGKELCHRCDNSLCWREDHLFLGTHRENMIDAGQKGRVGFVRGEKHYAHKLTEEQVREIRQSYQPGNGYRLAELFGVTRTMVSKIMLRRNWKHVA